MKYFRIIKEKIAFMECVIESSMFYSFCLSLSIFLCNVDSALVSYSNSYIWISNCIHIFEFIFECWRNVIRRHALEKWRLQKKATWKRKEISLLLLLSSLNPKISFFYLERGEGCFCWAWSNARRGFLWINVTKRDGGEKVGQKRCNVIVESPLLPFDFDFDVDHVFSKWNISWIKFL